MATSDQSLSLVQLTQVALNAGLGLGFNAAGAESWLDSTTFERRIAFTFGDQKEMRKPRLRTPSEWALSYAEDEPCTREYRTVEVPYSMVFGSVHHLERRLVAELLEVVPA